MLRISLITMTTGLALFAATTSFAADQFTYRAGQAYMKSAASNHTECETQCRGDAACRGWNFVRPNPRSRSGICEFNARKAVPVSSPVSISGEINTGVDALMSHAVPIAGMGGNTVRVGTPIVPNRQIPKRRIAAPQMATAPRTGQQRRVVKRMPIPAARQVPTSATYKRTLPAGKDVRTPRVYGGEAPRIQAKPQANIQPRSLQERPMQKRQMTRQQIYQEQMRAAQQRAARQQAPRQQVQMQAPQMQAPRMPQQNPYAQNPYTPNPYAQQMPPQAQIQARPQAQIAPNQASLYGSLHDDLTQNMTPVPRPQTAPDHIENADAPVSTSRAVPTKPVQAEPIGYPAIPGLAGGG